MCEKLRLVPVCLCLPSLSIGDFFGNFFWFQIGKISVVNPKIGKFVIVHNYVILVNKKIIAITHTLTIKKIEGEI